MHLDRVDRKILRAVQSNCMLGTDELSNLCDASPSTILRRLKKMRKAGVITSEVALVDPKMVGRPLLFILGVRLERDDADVAADFTRKLKENPAVMQCFLVTGAADYIVHVSAKDMEEYERFVQSMLISNPHVTMTETNVVISPLKLGLSVPIDEENLIIAN